MKLNQLYDMEAPEKLYILFNHPHTVDYTKLNKRRNEEEVEYTRTDAFIEKACKYFAPYISDNSGGHERVRIIEDFKKVMKGE